jgi:hypothetical protein
MKATLSRIIFQHPKIVVDSGVDIMYNPCLETRKIFGKSNIVLDCMLNVAYNSLSKMEIPIQERRNRWLWNMQSSSFAYLVVALLATN